MSKYYLRIEGVNFDSFVLDTNHIKIIRGGSLMLLNSVDWLAEKFPDLKKITAGASWGLFSFHADNDYQAGQLLRDARAAFNTDKHYKHATMTLAVQPAGGDSDYSQTRSQLEALSRWEQMQSPTVAIPTRPEPSNNHGACQLDKLRPATKTASLRRDGGSKKAPISASCRVRWEVDGKERKPKNEHGSGQKQFKSFYEKRTDIQGLSFTEDLNELSDDKRRNNLHGKMAVVYLDGNHFGKLARDSCFNEAKQREFDQKLREKYQNGALKTLLTEIKDDPAWKNGNKIRLETLLWGGDEIIWVAPAWKGWWLLARFFQITNEPPWEIDDKPLTHGAGLVFCHHNAPIQPILGLARELGDLAKANDRKNNRAAYQVLESFDHTGADLSAVREQRWPLKDASTMILDGNAMISVENVMQEIKASELPKRQLYRIATIAQSDPYEAEDLAKKLQQEADITPKIDELERCFGAGLATWLHLLELWDYVGLEEPTP